MESELLPCPFCGEAANKIIGNPEHGNAAWYAIECMSCECKTDYFPILNDAIKLWNNRTNKERTNGNVE